ncbi:MAG: hypothetical protein ABIE84_05010 [bacterium]
MPLDRSGITDIDVNGTIMDELLQDYVRLLTELGEAPSKFRAVVTDKIKAEFAVKVDIANRIAQKLQALQARIARLQDLIDLNPELAAFYKDELEAATAAVDALRLGSIGTADKKGTPADAEKYEAAVDTAIARADALLGDPNDPDDGYLEIDSAVASAMKKAGMDPKKALAFRYRTQMEFAVLMGDQNIHNNKDWKTGHAKLTPAVRKAFYAMLKLALEGKLTKSEFKRILNEAGIDTEVSSAFWQRFFKADEVGLKGFLDGMHNVFLSVLFEMDSFETYEDMVKVEEFPTNLFVKARDTFADYCISERFYKIDLSKGKNHAKAMFRAYFGETVGLDRIKSSNDERLRPYKKIIEDAEKRGMRDEAVWDLIALQMYKTIYKTMVFARKTEATDTDRRKEQRRHDDTFISWVASVQEEDVSPDVETALGCEAASVVLNTGAEAKPSFDLDGVSAGSRAIIDGFRSSYKKSPPGAGIGTPSRQGRGMWTPSPRAL